MVSPPSVSLPPIPTPPPTPMPLMPAQGTKPRSSSTTLSPTILGSVAPPRPSQTGANTLLGQA